jgi:hypothetical protein
MFLENVLQVAWPVFDRAGVAVNFDLIQPLQKNLFIALWLEADAALIQPARQVKGVFAFDEVLAFWPAVDRIAVKLISNSGLDVGDDVSGEMLFWARRFQEWCL